MFKNNASNANKQFQEQQRLQQERLRQQQMQAAYIADQKRKKEQQIQNAADYGRKLGAQDVVGGGARINANRDVNVDGDVVGRDKHQNIDVKVPTEEKSGCVYAIERAGTFIVSLLIGGLVLGLLLGGIGLAVLGQVGAIAGAAFGVLIALGMAIANAGNVKKTKGI